MQIRGGIDLVSGLAFIGIGLFVAVQAALGYGLGTPMRMGPGFFPACVGLALAGVGMVVVIRALLVGGPPLPTFAWWPILLVMAATLVFGFLVSVVGLVLATIACVVIGAAAGPEFRLREALVLGIVLAVLSVLIFVTGLHQLFPIWPRWLA